MQPFPNGRHLRHARLRPALAPSTNLTHLLNRKHAGAHSSIMAVTVLGLVVRVIPGAAPTAAGNFLEKVPLFADGEEVGMDVNLPVMIVERGTRSCMGSR
jgi:hypothetical protein